MSRTDRRAHRPRKRSQPQHSEHDLLPPTAASMAALEEATPGAVAARASDRLSFAHDASHYLLTPRAVVSRRRTPAQVAALLRVSAARGVPLTFRSGGTSLSGQATADGVLVDTRRNFRDIEVLDDGARVRSSPERPSAPSTRGSPGTGASSAPTRPARSACTIGGVVANNSSGMACGIELEHLPHARVGRPRPAERHGHRHRGPDADDRLRALEPRSTPGWSGCATACARTRRRVATIRRLYAIKNTMGYGVNSFVDHDRPVDILDPPRGRQRGHAGVRRRGDVPDRPGSPARGHRRSWSSPTSPPRPRSLPDLVDAGFATIELLDATSLRVAQRDPEAADDLRALAVRDHAALLVEYQEPTAEALDDRVGWPRPTLLRAAAGRTRPR